MTANTKGAAAETRDAEIARLAVTGQSTATIGITFGITDTRVRQILGKTTGRMEVLRYLLDHEDDKAPDSRELALALNLDINKVQYAVDTLKKRGRATFTRSTSGKHGDHATMFDIKLTPLGAREATKLFYPGPAVILRTSNLPKTNGHAKEPMTTAEVPADGRLWANDGEGTPFKPMEPAPVVPGPEVPTLEEVMAAPVELAAHDIPRYPLIDALTQRDTRLQEAARLIEKAGYDDVALLVYSKLDDFTPLEREILKFIEAHP